jgi:hypothetical protein
MLETPLAWRVWKVVDHEGEIKLRSPSVHWCRPWRPGRPIVAKCEAGGTHTPPDDSCECGIWGLDTLDRLREYAGRRDWTGEDYVVALMALAGDVLCGEIGYRAAEAYPVRIYLPHLRWQTAQRL